MDMKFDTMRILNVVDGKDPEAAAAIIGKAIIESVTTAEKMFKGSLELDITDSLVERIDAAKPKNFHQQLRERIARHNSVEIPEEPKQPKRRGRPPPRKINNTEHKTHKKGNAMNKSQLKWYDINKKKPEFGQRVLIADDCADQVVIGTFTEDKEDKYVWKLDCGADILTDHLPYWTDLPEHPQKFDGVVDV